MKVSDAPPPITAEQLEAAVQQRTIVAEVAATASRSEHREPIMQFFSYQHLKPELAEVSMPFCMLAHRIVDTLPRNPERTVALRKLLEAKDAAVRALMMT